MTPQNINTQTRYMSLITNEPEKLMNLATFINKLQKDKVFRYVVLILMHNKATYIILASIMPNRY